MVWPVTHCQRNLGRLVGHCLVIDVPQPLIPSALRLVFPRSLSEILIDVGSHLTTTLFVPTFFIPEPIAQTFDSKEN